jgi:pimeloyl-ACP methyl ester carboxylesterase
MSNSAAPVRHTVTAPGGVRLAAREYPGDGPTVLLLHGYPDNQAVWDRVVPLLTGRHRVLTYDVRGAGGSDAPPDVPQYSLRCLLADLVAVFDALAPAGPVHLVGHDWGSIQLWEAVTEPALAPRIASFTSVSGPCLDHAGQWMRDRWRHPRGWPHGLRQLGKSWYIGYFQLPVLPELAWRSGLAGRLVQRGEGLPVRPAADDGRHGLALYRANMFRRLGVPRQRRTDVPVQLVVPTRDRFVDPRLLADTERWAPRLRRHTLDARHWVPYSHPERLAGWIAGFVDDVERDRVPA